MKYISRGKQSRNQRSIVNALEGYQQSCRSREELSLFALSVKKWMI